MGPPDDIEFNPEDNYGKAKTEYEAYRKSLEKPRKCLIITFPTHKKPRPLQ
jgi:hypothetical protein